MRLIISLLSLAGFVAIADMRVVDPLLPVMAREFGVTIALGVLGVWMQRSPSLGPGQRTG